MILTQAEISGFRNLSSAHLDLSPDFNIITGDNGAGKTSILEAIHLLSTGYSFRTRKIRELIQQGGDHLTVTARLQDPTIDASHRAGIKKTLAGETSLKLDFEPLHSMAEMTRMIPVKALFPDSHGLIQDGPSGRRQFLDWGLFHVEPSFFRVWKQYRRALDQRNHSLRKQLPTGEIVAWNAELAEAGDLITRNRFDYVQDLQAWIKHYVKAFSVEGDISIIYKKGWSGDTSLKVALEDSFSQCQRFKTTTVGPHRGELSIDFNGTPAKQILSRGEQKLLVYALHFAQLALFTAEGQTQAIVLCDDLPAELDQTHLGCVLDSLQTMQLQTFITSNGSFDVPKNAAAKEFHVERGEVQEVV